MEKEIAKIKKNDNTDIIVRVDEYNGKKGVTIREFVTSEKYTGFTKSGTRIPVEAFESFKEAINGIDPADLVQTESAPANETPQEAPEE
jgi:hypothetical protein